MSEEIAFIKSAPFVIDEASREKYARLSSRLLRAHQRLRAQSADLRGRATSDDTVRSLGGLARRRSEGEVALSGDAVIGKSDESALALASGRSSAEFGGGVRSRLRVRDGSGRDRIETSCSQIDGGDSGVVATEHIAKKSASVIGIGVREMRSGSYSGGSRRSRYSSIVHRKKAGKLNKWEDKYRDYFKGTDDYLSTDGQDRARGKVQSPSGEGTQSFLKSVEDWLVNIIRQSSSTGSGLHSTTSAKKARNDVTVKLLHALERLGVL